MGSNHIIIVNAFLPPTKLVMAVVREVLLLIAAFSLNFASGNARATYFSMVMFDDDDLTEAGVQNVDGKDNEVGLVQQKQPTEEAIIVCIRLIAENNPIHSSSRCQSITDAAIDYCSSLQSQTRTGEASTTEVDLPCGNMLAALDREYHLCSLRAEICALSGNKACAQVDPERPCKRRRLTKCKPSQLEGQIPGSKEEKQCIDINMITRSNTIQQPISSFATRADDSLVKVYTMPIGQGDCGIITCNEGQNVIVFDCGASGGNYFLEDYNFIQAPIKKAKSAVILISHGHADHYSMIKRVFEGMEGKIKAIVLGGKKDDYNYAKLPTFKGTIEYISSGSIVRKNYCNNAKIWFDFIPGNIEARNKNERGMMMKLHCDKCRSSLLFAADMEGPAAKDFGTSTDKTIRSFLDVTHYKLAHHGAINLANHEEWLRAINPVEVHVSHQYNGRYKHPRCKAIENVFSYCGTVGIAGGPFYFTHDFSCFDDQDKHVYNDQNIHHRVFSTAPRDGMLCLIVTSFNTNRVAETQYYCGTPEEFTG